MTLHRIRNSEAFAPGKEMHGVVKFVPRNRARAASSAGGFAAGCAFAFAIVAFLLFLIVKGH